MCGCALSERSLSIVAGASSATNCPTTTSARLDCQPSPTRLELGRPRRGRVVAPLLRGVQELPRIIAASARQAQSGASQAQFADLVQHPGNNEIQQLPGFAGDGETRTRTGDTTIFSRAVVRRRMAKSLEIIAVSARMPRSPDVRNLRIFIAVCGNGGRLRPKFASRCEGKHRGPSFELGTEPLGGHTRSSEEAGTSSAATPTTACRPDRARDGQQAERSALCLSGSDGRPVRGSAEGHGVSGRPSLLRRVVRRRLQRDPLAAVDVACRSCSRRCMWKAEPHTSAICPASTR